MKFEFDEVRPGEALKLKLKAAPNSKIAVTAVDKSVHFLAKGNDLKEDDVSSWASKTFYVRGSKADALYFGCGEEGGFNPKPIVI